MAIHAGTDREQQLNDILLTYLDDIEAGRQPDRQRLLNEHPDFAAELAEFFAGRDRLESLQPRPARAGVDLSSCPTRIGVMHAEGPLPASALPPSLAPETGRLGDFQLLREIGRGGMGIVYEARQISLDRRVALKVLPFAAALDPKHLQRFKNEAQAAAQLHHSNIVPVYAVGCERSVHYYAMQFVEGQSLAAMIEELRAGGQAAHGEYLTPRSPLTGPTDEDTTGSYLPPFEGVEKVAQGELSVTAADETPPHGIGNRSTEHSIRTTRFFRRVAEIGVKAAQALEHAHQLGVIHRDVKPANLMLDVNGNLWVTDFGLALFKSDSGLTMTGELLVTLRYMSPEQTFAKRGLVDHRTDIYSLGATLYELLTLEQVFSGHDRQELLHQIAYEEPIAPRYINNAIPIELETIVQKALAKNPLERYSTAQELADDLERFLEDKPILARRPTLLEKATKWRRRHRAVVNSLAALFVLAFIGMGAIAWVVWCEEGQTRKALAEASAQRQRAETSFQEAGRALDSFVEMALQDLDKPQYAKVRKRFLEGALRYYRSILKQRPDDPVLQADLAVSAAYVARIVNDEVTPAEALSWLESARRKQEQVAQADPNCPECKERLEKIKLAECALSAGDHVALLMNCKVQKELGMCSTQIGKIIDHAKHLGADELKTCQTFAKLSADEQRKQFAIMVAANEKDVLSALTAGQQRRLHQIRYQERGILAFSDPEVVSTLQLTPEQQGRIEEIQEENARAWMIDLHSDGKRLQVQTVTPTGPENVSKILHLLTADQRARWRKLAGKPFRPDHPQLGDQT
jgi:serine/threonine protein kinase